MFKDILGVWKAAGAKSKFWECRLLVRKYRLGVIAIQVEVATNDNRATMTVTLSNALTGATLYKTMKDKTTPWREIVMDFYQKNQIQYHRQENYKYVFQNAVFPATSQKKI
eukprot:6287017-Karenia_brevis.AAC.1